MNEEKKEGTGCKTDSKCCGCKKFFLGVLAGLALAVLAHCLVCGDGGSCHKGYKMMCPMTQVPAR
jgi:hypothetical protein